MKRLSFILFASALLTVLFGAGMVLAAPQQGLLVDQNGNPVTGFSNVWIEDGVAYPVYYSATHQWYSVFIVGTGQGGVVLCTIGPPMGTGGDFNDGRGGNNEEEGPSSDDDGNSTNPV
jgi:hypothetical protein